MTHRVALALVCVLLLVPGAGRGEEGSFDSNGVKIYYYIEGKGEPVLLIHGFTANAQMQWGLSGILKTLAKDHRVIALDLRGHGKSGKPTEVKQYGIEMVEDAVRLLDHLEIKKAHVVGYSMGALITSKLLTTHPDRLLSATLGGAGALPAGVKLPSYIEKTADSLENGKGIGPLLMFLTPPGKPKPSETAIQTINRMFVGDNGKQLAAVIRSWKTLAVPLEKLKSNKVPTLALIGEVDPLKESVDVIKDRMGNLKVVVIDGADHVTAFTSPKFIHDLREFLDKHQQKGKAAKKEKAPAGTGK